MIPKHVRADGGLDLRIAAHERPRASAEVIDSSACPAGHPAWLSRC
jgi:hypothetical protein